MMFHAKNDFPLLQTPSADFILCQDAQAPETLLAQAGSKKYLAVTWEQECAESALQPLAEALGRRLLLSEVWREIFPAQGILISSSLSGGKLQQRLEEAAQAAPGRCWLQLERLRHRFTLPCPTGCGEKLAQTEPLWTPDFFDPSLCCQYCHHVEDGQGQLILFDTEETLHRKLELAKEAGFQGAVVLT